MIDTGSGVPAYAGALEAALAHEAGAPALVLVTHHHRDHQGGLAQVAAVAPDAPVAKRPHPKDRAAPTRALAGGEVLEAEGVRLVALHTPGHASDHLCFYQEATRALFTGDLILGGTTTTVPVGDGDLGDYLASLERLLALDLAVLYPGHGEPIDEPHAYIRQYLAHRQMRERQVLEALRDGHDRPESIAARIYPAVASGLVAATRDQVLSHLLKLERDGIVAREPAGPDLRPRFRLR
jgi:glyoxylase-like metal-dependent hydrolase (beta-lactamase superfamily II)